MKQICVVEMLAWTMKNLANQTFAHQIFELYNTLEHEPMQEPWRPTKSIMKRQGDQTKSSKQVGFNKI